MQYSEGRIGRIFYIRIDHGEDLFAVLQDFIEERAIKAGIIHFLGALREGRMITGPKQTVLPPDPSYESYGGGWDAFGLATITQGRDRPHIHFHGSVGKGRQALTGCLRELATTYIIVEAIVIEMVGIELVRRMDPLTGLDLPEPGPARPG